VIRSNLATRPFYNERAVNFWLLVIAAAVLAASIFNVSQMIRYSRSDTELARQAATDEARAADLRAEAARLRGSIDARQIELASVEARQANDLIERRTFSWTELFNRLESTLPPNVRITSIQPRLANREMSLTISVVARSVDDVNDFMANLERTGVFHKLLPPQEHVNESGQIEGAVEAVYLPRPPAATAQTPASPPAAASTSGERGR
jgi:Tfp pilus assembly protein PilN